MNTPSLKLNKLLSGAALATLLSASPALADYQSTVVSQSPAGYWRMNETVQPINTTTATNIGSLGSSANGSYLANASGGVTGPFAGSAAVGLDGTSQYVNTPWTPGLNAENFTFETWVNPTEVPKFGYVASSLVVASPRTGWYLAQDDGSTFNVGSAFVVRFFYNNGTSFSGQLSAPVTQAGVWYHLVITLSGTTASLYTNGVLAMATTLNPGMVANVGGPFTVGCRSDIGLYWPGKAAETAIYTTALSAARVAAHYSAGMSTPATYQATVTADAPVLYHRYKEAGSPPAANLGTLGSAVNGGYRYPATAGVSGAVAPTYPGFPAPNYSVGISSAGGTVAIPPLNLQTNTVTYTAWVKPSGPQATAAGIIVTGSGTTASGLTMDQVRGGFGLGYVWGGNNYGISPSFDFGLPTLPDNDWSFVALVIQPTKASLYVCDTTKYDNWASMDNTFNVNHANQSFNTTTLIGAENGFSGRNFNGAIDEVAIFRRALSAGELYTAYASAVGGVPARVFADLTGPEGSVPVGDPIVLRVDAGGTPPLSYTWRRGGTQVGVTTNGVFTIPSAVLGDTGNYDVTVANASGSASSGPIGVSVVTPVAPSIVSTEGFLNRTLYPGATLSLSVNATGGGLKYQWYKNAAPLASATASAYLVASVTSTDAGNYSVRVTNSLGSVSNGPVAITIPTPATNSYAGLVVASAPEAWWRLDETSGATNLFDAMGRHNGYYTNLSNSVPPVVLGVPGALVGDPNTAASFSGNGGVGVIPYSPRLNPTKFTYEVWVRTTASATPEISPLSSCSPTDGFWWGTSTSLGGCWAPRSSPNSVAPVYDYLTDWAIVPNAWTHLVITYDSTRGTGGGFPYDYFINGKTDDYIWSGVAPTISGNVIIGGRGRSATLADLFFSGQVDEVAVYPRVLSATEITNHYTARGVEIIPPTFTTPLLSQTVASGKTISFTTTVLGTTPVLQWLKDGTPLAGATNATLNLPVVTPLDQGIYTLRASNSAATNTTSATLTVISPTAYAVVTNNLVLHLRGDGNTTDTSGRGNNGTAFGALAYVPGLIGPNALEYTTTLAGTNVATASYVRLGSPADLQFGTATSFSVSLWVKLPAGVNQPDLPFIGNATNSMNNPGWVLGPTYNTGGWQWCLNDGANNLDVNGPASSIGDGNWHHFLLTVDRTAKLAKGYVDGILVSSRDITTMGSLDNGGAAVTIGQDPTGLYNEAGTAILDDIGVWRQALTAAQVAQIESAGRIGNSFSATPVVITAPPAGGNLTLTWTEGTLYQSDKIGAGAVWTPVPGATPPSYIVVPSGSNKFYRVGP